MAGVKQKRSVYLLPTLTLTTRKNKNSIFSSLHMKTLEEGIFWSDGAVRAGVASLLGLWRLATKLNIRVCYVYKTIP